MMTNFGIFISNIYTVSNHVFARKNARISSSGNGVSLLAVKLAFWHKSQPFTDTSVAFGFLYIYSSKLALHATCDYTHVVAF